MIVGAFKSKCNGTGLKCKKGLEILCCIPGIAKKCVIELCATFEQTGSKVRERRSS